MQLGTSKTCVLEKKLTHCSDLGVIDCLATGSRKSVELLLLLSRRTELGDPGYKGGLPLLDSGGIVFVDLKFVDE